MFCSGLSVCDGVWSTFGESHHSAPLETSVEDQHSRNDSMDIENHAFLKKLSVKGAIFHSYRYVKPGG